MIHKICIVSIFRITFKIRLLHDEIPYCLEIRMIRSVDFFRIAPSYQCLRFSRLSDIQGCPAGSTERAARAQK